MRFLILSFIFTILSFFFDKSYAANPTQYTPEQIRLSIKQSGGHEQFIKSLANNAAKVSGQMIDAHTEIIGAIANEKTIVYYSRLVNLEASEIKDVSNLRTRVASINSKAICSAPIASILINEHKAEYRYMVYSKSRAYLFSYAFNQVTCSPTYRW